MELIADTRRRRLRQWIDERCNSSQTDFVAGTGVQLSQLGQWLSGLRNMSEKSARRLEVAKSMPRRWLDDIPDVPDFDRDTIRVAQLFQDMNQLDERSRRLALAFQVLPERDKEVIEFIARIRASTNDDKQAA